MGTRADFYKGHDKKEGLHWIGSIAWDGYPRGIPEDVLKAGSEKEYTEAVRAHIESQQDSGSRFADQGWPWSWNDSSTTDYAYTFDEGKVYASRFGSGWFDVNEDPELRGEDDFIDAFYDRVHGLDGPAFPDMRDQKRVTDGGFIIFSASKGMIE
jgi:hypothetical protein